MKAILNLLKLIYIKLFKINDTPQKVALGFGIGVFLGIIPATGPIAALVVASFLHINRAAAVLGSLLTNTWTSILTIILSIKLGSAIMRLSWQEVYTGWLILLNDFHWGDLFKLSILKIILPVIIGYFVIAFCLSILVYLIFLLILTKIKHESKNRIKLSR
jgi:uncharacterized protein (DUF2062 family)